MRIVFRIEPVANGTQKQPLAALTRYFTQLGFAQNNQGQWQRSSPALSLSPYLDGAEIDASLSNAEAMCDCINIVQEDKNHYSQFKINHVALLLARQLGWAVYSEAINSIVATPLKEAALTFHPDFAFDTKQKNAEKCASFHGNHQDQWRPKGRLLAKDENQGYGSWLSPWKDELWLYGFFKPILSGPDKMSRLQIRDKYHKLIKDIPGVPNRGSVNPSKNHTAVFHPRSPGKNNLTPVSLLDHESHEFIETPITGPLLWLSDTELLGFARINAEGHAEPIHHRSTQLLFCNFNTQNHTTTAIFNEPLAESENEEVTAIALDKASNKIYVALATKIKAIDLNDGTTCWQHAFHSDVEPSPNTAKHTINDIALSHCGHYLSIVSDVGTGDTINGCVVLNTADGSRTLSLPLGHHNYPYLSTTWHPNGWFVATQRGSNSNPVFIDLWGQTRSFCAPLKGEAIVSLTDTHVLIMSSEKKVREYPLLDDELGERRPLFFSEETQIGDAEKTFTALMVEVNAKHHFGWLYRDRLKHSANDYTAAIPVLIDHLSTDDHAIDAALFLLRFASTTLKSTLKQALIQASEHADKTTHPLVIKLLARQAYYENDWRAMESLLASKEAFIRRACFNAIDSELFYRERTNPQHEAIERALVARSGEFGKKNSVTEITIDIDKNKPWPPTLDHQAHIAIMKRGLSDKNGTVRQAAVSLWSTLSGEFQLDLSELVTSLEPLFAEKNSKILKETLKAASAILKTTRHDGLIQALVTIVDSHPNGRIQTEAWNGLSNALKNNHLDTNAKKILIKRLNTNNHHSDVIRMFAAEIFLKDGTLQKEVITLLIDAIEEDAFSRYTGRKIAHLLTHYAKVTPELMPRMVTVLRSQRFLKEANEIHRLCN